MNLLRTLAILAATTCLPNAQAQAPTGSILRVEMVNATLYARGYCGPADMGQNPNKLPRPTLRALSLAFGIADIVSVNGQPIKGTALEVVNANIQAGNAMPGVSAIGDFGGTPSGVSWDLGFLTADGTKFGTLHIDGSAGGTTTPGAPKEVHGAYTVTGGTGAFFGVRGYFAPDQDPASPERQTTDCEDPFYRRVNADPGGNKRHTILYLVPIVQPQIISVANGPAVVHSSDGSLVTAAKPATAGEILSLFASGLGPTRPGVDPGQPFPANPPQVVNSPVQVLVNGNPTDVLYAGGYPGAVDGYQVNFTVPAGAAAGPVSLQLSIAWMSGPAVTIPVR